MEQKDFTFCRNAIGNNLNSCALSLLKVKKDCTCICAEESVFAPMDELPKGILCCKIQQMSIRMAGSLLQWFVKLELSFGCSIVVREDKKREMLLLIELIT